MLKDSVPCPIPNVQEVGRSTALASGVENTKPGGARNVQLIRSPPLRCPSLIPVAETTQNRLIPLEEINKGLRKPFSDGGLAQGRSEAPVPERGRKWPKTGAKPGIGGSGLRSSHQQAATQTASGEMATGDLLPIHKRINALDSRILQSPLATPGIARLVARPNGERDKDADRRARFYVCAESTCRSCNQRTEDRRAAAIEQLARPMTFCGLSWTNVEMAEKKGFEPSIPFPVYSLSRGAPSTTRPPLR